MARFLLALVVFALAVAILKMVIVALIIAGLIFRTRETIGLLLLGGLITLIAAQPFIGLGLLVVFAVVAVANKRKPPDDPTLIE